MAEWQAYWTVEPFGPPAAFWQAALVASMLANVHRKKNQKPYKPEDFMPKGLVANVERDQELAGQLIAEQFHAYADAVNQGAIHGE